MKIFKNVIYSFDDKAEFSAAITPVSHELVWQDPLEIILICWFCVQEAFLIIINVKKLFVLINIFVETVIYFLSGFCDE